MPEKTTPTRSEGMDATHDKRTAILLAARDIFVRQGYEETTIAQIAAAAGIAVGTVYLYYHNKREIYVAASCMFIDNIVHVLQITDADSLPIQQMPRIMVKFTFKMAQNDEAFSSLLQIDAQNPEELRIKRDKKRELSEALSNFLQCYIARGDLPPFDTNMYSRILCNMFESTFYDCFYLENGVNQDAYRATLIDLTERLLLGPPLRP